MKEKAIVVIEENRAMSPQQVELLDSTYGEWEKLLVPASGWDKEQQMKQVGALADVKADKVIVAPVPLLLMQLATRRGVNSSMAPGTPVIFRGALILFHEGDGGWEFYKSS